jgi:hypothetical protein
LARLEAVKEIRLLFYLLKVTEIPIKSPKMVRTENIVAKFMAETPSSGVRTRHIDTRYHFTREHIENGFIKIVCI